VSATEGVKVASQGANGTVKALAAEGAQIPLDVRVALGVSVEQPLQIELLQCHTDFLPAQLILSHLSASAASVCAGFGCRIGRWVNVRRGGAGLQHGILDTVATVDPLDSTRSIRRYSGSQRQLKITTFALHAAQL
jgi:hypothetical protein